MVVFAAKAGDRLHKGDLVAEVIDPIANQTHRVMAGVDGVFYGRASRSFGCRGRLFGWLYLWVSGGCTFWRRLGGGALGLDFCADAGRGRRWSLGCLDRCGGLAHVSENPRR